MHHDQSNALPFTDQLLTLQQGGEQSRGALLETYQAHLTLLAGLEIGRRLHTKVDASDIVQETFLEAHRGFASFRGRGDAEFAAWLRGMLARRISLLVRHHLGTQRRDVRRESTKPMTNSMMTTSESECRLFRRDTRPRRSRILHFWRPQ